MPRKIEKPIQGADRTDRLLAEWQAERPELDAAAMAVVGRLLGIGRQLEARVLITSGAMTACLDRLERNGLIARVADQHDRRSSAAERTMQGRKLIDKAIAVRFGEAAEALAGLSEGECSRLAALLKKLGRNLER